ncbi:DUF2975 domain-containing protein [Kaarinaea lacus]
MDNRLRIQRVSHKFKLLFIALIFIIPLTELMLWLFYNQLPNNHFFLLHDQIQGELSLSVRMQLFLASLIPIGILTYGVFILIKLFRLYEKKIVFTAENVRHYRRLGFVAISWVVGKVIYLPICSLILSFQQSDNNLFISLGLQSVDLFVLVTGVIVILVSWIMDEARRLEEEQAYTV